MSSEIIRLFSVFSVLAFSGALRSFVLMSARRGKGLLSRILSARMRFCSRQSSSVGCASSSGRTIDWAMKPSRGMVPVYKLRVKCIMEL